MHIANQWLEANNKRLAEQVSMSSESNSTAETGMSKKVENTKLAEENGNLQQLYKGVLHESQ